MQRVTCCHVVANSQSLLLTVVTVRTLLNDVAGNLLAPSVMGRIEGAARAPQAEGAAPVEPSYEELYRRLHTEQRHAAALKRSQESFSRPPLRPIGNRQ